MSENFFEPSFDTLSWEADASVLFVRLNRPNKHNAINLEMMRELRSAFTAAAANPDIHVVVLAANGGKSFSAGIDLSAGILEDVAEMKRSMMEDFLPLVESMSACHKPIIASVEGAAIGLACSLVLHCDWLIMSDRASLNPVFSDMGLVGDGGINGLLPRKIGYSQALRILLEAKVLSAADCLEMGLAYQVLAGQGMDEQVRALARKLASRATLPQGLTKQLLAASMSGASLREVILLEANAQAECASSEYFQQAYARLKGK